MLLFAVLLAPSMHSVFPMLIGVLQNNDRYKKYRSLDRESDCVLQRVLYIKVYLHLLTTDTLIKRVNPVKKQEEIMKGEE